MTINFFNQLNPWIVNEYIVEYPPILSPSMLSPQANAPVKIDPKNIRKYNFPAIAIVGLLFGHISILQYLMNMNSNTSSFNVLFNMF